MFWKVFRVFSARTESVHSRLVIFVFEVNSSYSIEFVYSISPAARYIVFVCRNSDVFPYFSTWNNKPHFHFSNGAACHASKAIGKCIIAEVKWYFNCVNWRRCSPTEVVSESKTIHTRTDTLPNQPMTHFHSVRRRLSNENKNIRNGFRGVAFVRRQEQTVAVH